MYWRGKWGSVTNNDEWQENVLQFFERSNQFTSMDFIYGYCSHVLADIQNNRKIYLPFKKRVNEESSDGEKSRYHHESSDIDYELSLDYRICQMFKLLKESELYEIDNIIYENELDKMKNGILFKQYTNVVSKDLGTNQYVTLERIRSFVKEESEFIMELLF